MHLNALIGLSGLCVAAASLVAATAFAKQDVAATIIAMERAALERWGHGDPSGFLEISAPQVTYFDPFLERRLDGLEALTRYYDGLRGKIRIEGFELLNPHVELVDDMAVLSFNYASWGGNDAETSRSFWNCTEVYRRIDGRWRIVQTHWSQTKPVVQK